MAGPLLLRNVLLYHFRLQNFRPFVAGISVNVTPNRLFCSSSTAPVSAQTDEKASHSAQISKLPDDPNDGEWKEKAFCSKVPPITTASLATSLAGRCLSHQKTTSSLFRLLKQTKRLSHHRIAFMLFKKLQEQWEQTIGSLVNPA